LAVWGGPSLGAKMPASLPPVPKGFMTKGSNEQKRQCSYNTTLRRVRATIVVVKIKQLVLHILGVCL